MPRVPVREQYAPSVVLGDDETLRLSSVGIDIGSATTQLVFSRITLQRQGNRYVTVDRAVTYESDIALTPFRGATIDGDALSRFVAEQYARAGVAPDDVDTGAVITTGVALDRHNAAVLADVFADQSGRFVSVVAGDDLEGALAAYGSGAVAASEAGRPVLNVDVGGGTTKLSLCRDGAVVATAALDVGARVLAWDAGGHLIRVEPAGRILAALAGVDVAVGTRLSSDERRRVVDVAARAVADAVRGTWNTALLRTARLVSPPGVSVVLSGGPSRYLLDETAPALGDLGPDLATRLAGELRGPVEIADASIRATVVGAGQFTVQVSGTTIHTSGPAVLPLRNRPVSVVGPGDINSLAERVARALAATEGVDGPVVLGAGWRGSADYATVDAFCRGLLEGLAAAELGTAGLVVVLDSDVAGLVGAHLAEECGYHEPLVVLDGVQLGRFDFVDIGDYLPHSASVPVTVKSLAFRSP